jgi:CheY-like chemotaxis protein
MAVAVLHHSEDRVRPTVGRCRVLVVDDEPLIGSTLAELLADDYDAVATTSAREALERLLRGQRYDAILCDLCMPEMSGVDLHDEIARRIPAQARRMIFMTGGVKEHAMAERLDSLPNAILLKPIELSVLQWALGECVRQPEGASDSARADQN